MSTLYLREVPEDVVRTLKERAAAEGKSLSAYAVGELVRIAARPTNADVVARLKSRDRTGGPAVQEILDALEEGRR